MRGRTRCRLHGGATPQGIASPHYRGKGYSQAVPKHLKDIYEARFNDPELLSLHKEIALCDTRIEDLLTQISGRMGDCIHQVSEAFLAFQKAHAAGMLDGEVGDLGRAIRRQASLEGPGEKETGIRRTSGCRFGEDPLSCLGNMGE